MDSGLGGAGSEQVSLAESKDWDLGRILDAFRLARVRAELRRASRCMRRRRLSGEGLGRNCSAAVRAPRGLGTVVRGGWMVQVLASALRDAAIDFLLI